MFFVVALPLTSQHIGAPHRKVAEAREKNQSRPMFCEPNLFSNILIYSSLPEAS